jgi:hypothetical protein
MRIARISAVAFERAMVLALDKFFSGGILAVRVARLLGGNLGIEELVQLGD